MLQPIPIGIIGGSGLYGMEGLEEVEEVAVETPFGPPSDRLAVGRLSGKRVTFLARHGRGHRILPSELKLSGQHLRHENPGGGDADFGQRGGNRSRKSIGRWIFSSRINSWIELVVGFRLSLERGWWGTSALPIRFAPT